MTGQPDTPHEPTQGAGETPQEGENSGSTKYSGCGAYRYCSGINKLGSRVASALGNLNLWIALGTWALALVSFWGVQRQLSLMESDQRAWVGETIVPTKLSFDGAGANIAFEYSLSNGGKSVANFAWLIIHAVPFRTPRGALPKVVWDLAKPPCVREGAQDSVGAVILPSDKTDAAPLSKRIDWATLSHFREGPDDPIGISLIGCVDYVPTVTGKHHQTFFWYIVGIPTPKGPVMPTPRKGAILNYALTKIPAGSSAN